MFKRSFDFVKPDVSVLGFGAMRFPTDGGGKIDLLKTQDMIDYAHLNGVNYFDTAYMYHEGKSEEALRETLVKKYPRDTFFLADKMPGWMVKNPEDAEKLFNLQLKRCGVEYFDFYLCHALTKPGFKVYEKFLLSFLIEKKKQGFIRHLGFSFHDSVKALEYISGYYGGWDFAQIQYNYIDYVNQNAKEKYEVLKKKNIPAIIMEPVRGGLLASLSPASDRVFLSYDKTLSPASWAIRFAMSPDNVLTVLSGMSSLEQVKDNIKTATAFKPLSGAEYKVINDALSVYKKNSAVPCTGCRYCADCPAGVDIPNCFSRYNEYIAKGCEDKYTLSIKENTAKKTAAEFCAGCRTCVKHCPQKIDIPSELKKISAVDKSFWF